MQIVSITERPGKADLFGFITRTSPEGSGEDWVEVQLLDGTVRDRLRVAKELTTPLCEWFAPSTPSIIRKELERQREYRSLSTSQARTEKRLLKTGHAAALSRRIKSLSPEQLERLCVLTIK